MNFLNHSIYIILNYDNFRTTSTGGGGILEFAGFCLQACQLAFDTEPKSIKAEGKLNDDGCDIVASAELSYGNNKIAKISIDITENKSNVAKIVGTKGQFTVNLYAF